VASAHFRKILSLRQKNCDFYELIFSIAQIILKQEKKLEWLKIKIGADV
jgi:hypothetical protein